MKLVFFCPRHHKAFECLQFTVSEEGGIVTDAAGRRTFDATVALDAPCPHCGERHVYRAADLPCPFEGRQGAIRKPSMTDAKRLRLTETVTGAG